MVSMVKGRMVGAHRKGTNASAGKGGRIPTLPGHQNIPKTVGQ